MQAQAERPLAKRVGLRLRSSSSGKPRCLGRARLERTPSSASVLPRVGRASPPEALEKRTSSWPLTVLTPGNFGKLWGLS